MRLGTHWVWPLSLRDCGVRLIVGRYCVVQDTMKITRQILEVRARLRRNAEAINSIDGSN